MRHLHHHVAVQRKLDTSEIDGKLLAVLRAARVIGAATALSARWPAEVADGASKQDRVAGIQDHRKLLAVHDEYQLADTQPDAYDETPQPHIRVIEMFILRRAAGQRAQERVEADLEYSVREWPI